MRKELQTRIPEAEWRESSKCISLAWDLIHYGSSSLEFARELSLSIIAHDRQAAINRQGEDGEGDARVGILAKPCFTILTRAETWLKDPEKEECYKMYIQGLIPLLTHLQAVLHEEEKKLKEIMKKDEWRNLRNETPNGKGEHECLKCLGELWHYYIECESGNLCIECFEKYSEGLVEPKSATLCVRRKDDELEMSKRINELIQNANEYCKTHNHSEQCWWFPEITECLQHNRKICQ